MGFQIFLGPLSEAARRFSSRTSRQGPPSVCPVLVSPDSGFETRWDLAVWLLYATFVGLNYHHALNSYWLYDDLQLLKIATTHHPLQYFFVPRVWHLVTVSNFTPLLLLSFDLDAAVFGFAPHGFYFHQLVALCLAAVMLAMVLKLWVSPLFAYMGGLLFLASAPAAAASELLMIRHYVEGAFFCLLAIYLFVVGVRKDSFALSLLSTLAYAAAISAKETYVPLALVLLLLPESRWCLRLKHAVFSLLVLAIYPLWRFWMLGGSVGGYQAPLFMEGLGSELYRAFVGNFAESITMFVGTSEADVLVQPLLKLILALFAIGALLTTSRRGQARLMPAVVGAYLSLYLPISPLRPSAADFITYRFVFLISLSVAFALPASAYRVLMVCKSMQANTSERPMSQVRRWRSGLWPRLIGCGLSVVLALAWYSSHRWLSTQRNVRLRPMAAEGRFLMSEDTSYLLVKSDFFPVMEYYTSIDHFRRLGSLGPAPDVVSGVFAHLDETQAPRLRSRRVVKFSTEANRITDVTAEFLRERAKYLAQIRKLPFHVRLMTRSGRFNYSLGPSHGGRHFILLGYRAGIYCTVVESIPRTWTGELVVGPQTWYVRFGWTSPQGWTVFSPEWLIDFSEKREIIWEEKGD